MGRAWPKSQKEQYPRWWVDEFILVRSATNLRFDRHSVTVPDGSDASLLQVHGMKNLAGMLFQLDKVVQRAQIVRWGALACCIFAAEKRLRQAICPAANAAAGGALRLVPEQVRICNLSTCMRRCRQRWPALLIPCANMSIIFIPRSDCKSRFYVSLVSRFACMLCLTTPGYA